MDEEGHERHRVSQGTEEEQDGLICRIFPTSFPRFPRRMRVRLRTAVESRMGINWRKVFQQIHSRK